MGGADIGDLQYLARYTLTIATCVDGITLKGLKRKVKINKLMVYSS